MIVPIRHEVFNRCFNQTLSLYMLPDSHMKTAQKQKRIFFSSPLGFDPQSPGIVSQCAMVDLLQLLKGSRGVKWLGQQSPKYYSASKTIVCLLWSLLANNGLSTSYVIVVQKSYSGDGMFTLCGLGYNFPNFHRSLSAKLQFLFPFFKVTVIFNLHYNFF